MELEAEFQELVLSDLDSVYSYALTLAGTRSEADDLLQATPLRAFRAFGSYKRHLNFKVWLFKIMKNAHIHRERRRRVRQLGDDWNRQQEFRDQMTKEVLPYPVPLNPEGLLLRRLTIEEVREAIRRKPGQHILDDCGEFSRLILVDPPSAPGYTRTQASARWRSSRACLRTPPCRTAPSGSSSSSPSASSRRRLPPTPSR